MARLQLKRGNAANLPTSGMLAGEPMVTLDRGNLHVATDASTRIPVTPAVDELTTLAAAATDDLLLLHDVSENAAQREKKMTFANFKSALNIPAESTDEKVAISAGGTAGYLYGTDGTDGVVRMGSSMSWTADGGSAFVTLDVSVVDGGTF